MNRIICAPESRIPKKLDSNTMYFYEYSCPKSTADAKVGHFGTELRHKIKKLGCGILPSIPAWDFMTIALSVASADCYVPRSKCVDGWTRVINIEIYLVDPTPWNMVKEQLQATLRFLTGDYWKIIFHQGGEPPEKPKRPGNFDADCISLLSGGLDSLVGYIDLISEKRKPILVSQNIDSQVQQKFAESVVKNQPHFQWSHAIHPQGNEASTRARSIVFFAFAAIVASYLGSKDKPFEIIVPENGVISLNIPLNPGRLGSLSTKTTHPVYLKGLQDIWEKVGIHAYLQLPYRFKTKGELLCECQNRSLIESFASQSISCGRFGRKHKHCGRCVPCMVRRAAFMKAGINDDTVYIYEDISASKSRPDRGSDDISAMAVACKQIEEDGIESLIQGNLYFASSEELSDYRSVVQRGFIELRELLKKYLLYD
jgi:hypothetical protein